MISTLGGLIVAGSAYLARDTSRSGLKKTDSHILFVESLARRAELKSRFEDMIKAAQVHKVGFVNVFVVLGQRSGSDTKEVMKKIVREEM